MKQLVLAIVLFMSCMTGMAQTHEKADTLGNTAQSSIFNVQSFIGYLSYDSVLVSMPQYAIVQAQMQELREAYDKEVKRVEEEFNQKYEAFLEGQKDFPRTILLKRQNELQDLMQKNIEFKQQGRRDLHQAEVDALAPLHKKLSQAIAGVAKKRGLALVVNTDSNACPFIEPSLSLNIQAEVEALLAK